MMTIPARSSRYTETMKLSVWLSVLVALLTVSSALAARLERLSFHQKQTVQVQHQRLVGNLKAQARREGVVVGTPQLYLFLSDYSAAFHASGIRGGMERQLDWVIDNSRTERNMVRLDRLLERLEDKEGAEVGLDDLPPADLYVVLYRRADCAACDALEAAVLAWLERRPELRAAWLDVSLDHIF